MEDLEKNVKLLEGYIPFLERQVETMKMFEEFNTSMFKFNKISWEAAQKNGIELCEGIKAGEKAINLAHRTINALQAKKPWGEPDYEEMKKVVPLSEELAKSIYTFTSAAKSMGDRVQNAFSEYTDGELQGLMKLTEFM